MPIISEAPESAHSSEYYIFNKNICEEWETYTANNNGTIDGSFTSWAIYFHGKIPNNNCSFQLKKSSTSNGNILIPSKKNIHNQTILLFTECKTLKESFVIRKKSFLDQIGLSSYKEVHQHYSTNSRGRTNEIDSLLKYFASHLDSKSIKEFFYNKSTKQFQITFNEIIEEPAIIEEIRDVLN